MKQRLITSNVEVEQLTAALTASASKALVQVSRLGSAGEGLAALWAMKFSTIGCDPLDSEAPLNLIEQLNQTFTYLASARAAKLLLTLHPEYAPFALNLGTAPGWDIESQKHGGLVAEVFAAVNIANNRKLAKDRARVAAAAAMHKYVFFMCPGYEEARQPKLEVGGVKVWSLACTP